MVGIRFLFFFIYLCVLSLPFNVGAQSIETIPFPQKLIQQEWKIYSYLDDCNLRYELILNVDFDTYGNVWLATSKGLFRYDGYRWKLFTMSDGLPSLLVRCVKVTRNGRILIGTDMGVVEYRDFQFQTFQPSVPSSDMNVRRIEETPDGTLWFCSDHWPDPERGGGLFSFKDGNWRKYTQSDGLPSDYVTNFLQDSQGRRFVLTDKGLAQWNGTGWFDPLLVQGFPEEEQFFWSIVESPKYGVLVSSDRALYVLNDEGWKRYESQYNQRVLIAAGEDEVYCFRDVDIGRRAFYQWNGESFARFTHPSYSPQGDVEHMRMGPDGSIWCVGYNTLYRWERYGGEWSEYDHVPPPQLVDTQGRIWFSDDQSTLRYDGQTWERLTPSHEHLLEDIHNQIWGWNFQAISRWNGERFLTYSAESIGLSEIYDFRFGGQGRAWAIGKDFQNRNAVAMLSGSEWQTRHCQDIHTFKFQQSATDPLDGVWYLFLDEKRNEIHLFRFTDTVCYEIPTWRVLSNQTIPKLYVDSKQQIWLYGRDGLFNYREKEEKWDRLGEIDSQSILDLSETRDGIWFSYRTVQGNGAIAHMDKDKNKWIHYSIYQTYLSTKDENGVPILISPRALYTIPSEEKRPQRLTLPTNQRVTGAVKDLQGRFWLGTGKTVLVYEANNSPPETLIVQGPDHGVLTGDTIRFRFRGQNAYIPNILPHTFQYSWRMNDGEWSPFQSVPEAGIHFVVADVGRQVLHVRSKNERGLTDTTPEQYVYYILPKSIYDQWYFHAFLVILFILVFVLAIYGLWAKSELTENARTLVKYAGTLEEKVERRTAALRESEERYRVLFTEMQNGYAIHEIIMDEQGNPCDYLYIDVNPAFEKIIGIDRQQVVGKKNSEIVPDADPFWLETFGKVALERNPVHFRHWGENTPKLLDCIAFSPMKNQCAVIYCDVTQQARMEEQLLHAQKLEAVGQLAGGMAHNLNNILTGLLGNLILAERNTGSNKYISEAKAATSRVADILHHLLEFSRKAEIQLSPTNLNRAIQDLFHFAQASMDRRIQMELFLPENSIHIHADRSQLETALMNLILNARDAIQDRMDKYKYQNEIPAIKIIVESIMISLDTAQMYMVSPEKSFVRISVSDNGIGMNQEVLGHLYEPFFTTKEVGRGTGLGLSSTFGIIQQHQGWMDVQSEEERGSSFQIYLPVLDAKTAMLETSNRSTLSQLR